MATDVDQLEATALKLRPEDRARLAMRLIASLDDHEDPDAEALWIVEAERRLDEMEAGTPGAPADAVFRRVAASLR